MDSAKPHQPTASEKEADALIAKQKVEALQKEGILIDKGTPYAHNSTYGGRLNAFIPRRIKAGNSLIGLLIFLIVIAAIELIGHFF